jgi:hypothetical protein
MQFLSPASDNDLVVTRIRLEGVMKTAINRVEVTHNPTMYAVEPIKNDEPQNLTMLELVEAVSEVTDDEQEIVATVIHMLESGSVRLAGNFHDEPVELLLSNC